MKYCAFILLIVMFLGCRSSEDSLREMNNYLEKYNTINNYEHFLEKLYKDESQSNRQEKILRLFKDASENPDLYEPLLNGINKFSIRDILGYYKANFGDSKDFSDFQEIVLAKNDKNIGLEIPNFKFTDKSGNRVNISDFRGKLIVIDFWATWCRPCLALESDYKDVVKSFEKDTSVQFLSIAVRQPYDSWVRHIEDDNHENLIHGRFENRSDLDIVLEVFDLLSIPKFVFIGKNQHIIYSNGPQPNNRYFKELISENL